MQSLRRWIKGYVCLEASAKKATEIMDILQRLHIFSWNHQTEGEHFFLCISCADMQKTRGKFSNEVHVKKTNGLAFFFHNHINRVGLPIGALLAAILFGYLNGFVWDIRIRGNHELPAAQIEEELRTAGLFVGVPFSLADRQHIANAALLSTTDLSYLSVNYRGTVAYVEVLERKEQPDSSPELSPANLVAAEDAVIEFLSVRSGDVRVHRGQVVQAGDLLVSGITEGTAGSHITRASGEIQGRVSRNFSVTIPRRMKKTAETSRKLIGISLIFLGKPINIYANTGNLPNGYDTIYEEEHLYVGNIRLPVRVQKTYAVWQTTEDSFLSDDAAVALAYRQMEEKVSLSLQGAELLEKHMDGQWNADTYVLTCRVACLVNIANIQEFSVK